MANEPAPARGPDLRQGVPAQDVVEGACLTGHVEGEAVLLTRSGGRLVAVGATCPHYGAPLGEGAIVDGTLRCPWHHAAFELATGAVVRPPAFGDLPCWEVVEREGRVSVGTRRSPAIHVRRFAGQQPESVVVVGGGAAGAVAVDTLRREGYAGPVTLLSAESSPPVDRPNLSKDYLAGSAPAEWIPLRPDAWYAEHDVALEINSRVLHLDVQNRRLTLHDGSTLPYGALLLATGADPIRLPLGADSQISYLRTLEDANAIIARARDARQAVIIGASFIGLEVAASLRSRGLEVTVLAPEALPLQRVLGQSLGEFVRDLHEERGVRFELGRTAVGADGSGVLLDDGRRITADLIVAGVGVRPNLELAEAGGLAVDRGIVVDAYLQTDAPSVFAAGDVARVPAPIGGRTRRIEHWVVAERQGRTAALNILGAGERYADVPFFWSAHYDTSIRYVGHAVDPDGIEVDGDPRDADCAVRFYEQGRLAAVATVGRDRESLLMEAELELAQSRQPEGTPA